MANHNLRAIMDSKTEEEKRAIYKKSGETRRKNNAEKHRMEKALNYALNKRVYCEGVLMSSVDAMVANMVNIARDPDDKRAVNAFNALVNLTDKIDSKEMQKNSLTIEGNNVQVVFSSETSKFSK